MIIVITIILHAFLPFYLILSCWISWTYNHYLFVMLWKYYYQSHCLQLNHKFNWQHVLIILVHTNWKYSNDIIQVYMQTMSSNIINMYYIILSLKHPSIPYFIILSLYTLECFFQTSPVIFIIFASTKLSNVYCYQYDIII